MQTSAMEHRGVYPRILPTVWKMLLTCHLSGLLQSRITSQVASAVISTYTSGDTYIDTSGGILTYKPCSQCRRGHYINKTCTQHADTVCEYCPVDTYSTGNSDGCKPCKVCKPGYYIRRKCSRSRDQKCVKCSNYAFSRTNNSVRCTACQSCKLHETVRTRCTRTHDCTCGDCKMDYFRDFSTEECLPCSFCYPGQTYVIDECFRKLGHSQFVCNPTYYRPVIPSDKDTNGEVYPNAHNATFVDPIYDADIIVVMVIVLAVIMIFSILFFVVFSTIFKSYTIQRIVRSIRDYTFTRTIDNMSHVYRNPRLPCDGRTLESNEKADVDISSSSIACTGSIEQVQTRVIVCDTPITCDTRTINAVNRGYTAARISVHGPTDGNGYILPARRDSRRVKDGGDKLYQSMTILDVSQTDIGVKHLKKSLKKFRRKTRLSSRSLNYIILSNNVYTPLLYNTV